MATGGDEAVQKALQSVAQSTGWTYSLLWRLCPRQGALVWAEGHYNGAIRTRKTTVQHQPGGGEAEDDVTTMAAGRAAQRRRSRQLKELYDSLLAADGRGGGDVQQQHQKVVPLLPRRPAAALAPEDLTETEWFYLMCASYCFPPAVGLPGEAFVRRVHVWLCGANKVDSTVFSRAILARSAGIQTVACIPVDDDGVLEIGTTEKVEEDICLIQYARGIFMDQIGTPTMPTLSGHSTSTPTKQINQQPFPKMGNCIGDRNVEKNSLNPKHNDEMEDDNDTNDLETNTGNDSSRHSPHHPNVGHEQGTLNAGSSELMMIGTSARVRDGCSNKEDEEIPVLIVGQNSGNLVAMEEFGQWRHFRDEEKSSKYLQPSAAEDQAALAENAHYVKTVLAILRFNACRQTHAASNTKAYLALSKNSSFSRWRTSRNHKATNDLTPQRMLKSILLGVPTSNHHRSYNGEAAVQSSPEPRDDGEGTSRSRRGLVVLSASHVLKERRRREKLNERFVMLRSMVPFVTKMDRASILGDTIEYVKQLRRRIQELEQETAMAQPPQAAASPETKRGRRHGTGGGYCLAQAGAGMAAAASGSCCDTTSSSVGEPAAPAAVAGDTEVQVSIVGSDDALVVELRCPHREGLLLRVMQALQQELRLEVTAVQTSLAGDLLLAELRVKVKEVDGRRSSISEVKRAVHLIVSSD